MEKWKQKGLKVYMEKKFEYRNVCARCGAVNTLEPRWIGRRVMHACSHCGKVGGGMTLRKWNIKHPDKFISKKAYEEANRLMKSLVIYW
jgi:hypothetical protein